ncbi:NUDIX hydrolase [Streptomyces aidingensis]|uniref:ADP-ribose pyrophosphatase YjhB, NUDIX family n=1 Tax=Streptomyces aidingensis TaxID=910347 RepID=A0A1I1VA77_9ACTN|nr:NUDIX domain-containing protein [Streptomyces aidingensis]SFD79799.1 ADP-ribose pyrophosphatase YjhB, NUDIX family [Streptomyces aidingensis]
MGHLPNVLGAHLLLERDGRVLLGQRAASAEFAPGYWHVPAGHVERETARECAVREAAEELGLALRVSDLELVHTLHHLGPTGPRMQLFFRATRWAGEPVNAEPDRCSELRWWPRTRLPDPLVDYTRTALAAIAAGRPYSEVGWPG